MNKQVYYNGSILTMENPLMVPSSQIKEIKVLQTIKEGKVVYTDPEYV